MKVQKFKNDSALLHEDFTRKVSNMVSKINQMREMILNNKHYY